MDHKVLIGTHTTFTISHAHDPTLQRALPVYYLHNAHDPASASAYVDIQPTQRTQNNQLSHNFPDTIARSISGVSSMRSEQGEHLSPLYLDGELPHVALDFGRRVGSVQRVCVSGANLRVKSRKPAFCARTDESGELLSELR